MSWTSPFTVASTMRPLVELSPVDSMNCSRWATAAFMVSADCSTNGSCISPAPNSSPTTFMPASRWSLMMASGSMPGWSSVPARASSSSSTRPLRSPSMMRCFSRSVTGQPLRSSLHVLDRLDVLEQLEDALQRVVRHHAGGRR